MNPEADFPNTDHIRMSSPVTVTAYELFGYGVVNVIEALYDCPPKDAADAEEAFGLATDPVYALKVDVVT